MTASITTMHSRYGPVELLDFIISFSSHQNRDYWGLPRILKIVRGITNILLNILNLAILFDKKFFSKADHLNHVQLLSLNLKMINKNVIENYRITTLIYSNFVEFHSAYQAYTQ